MLILGVYRPPKPKYQESEQLEHLTETADDFLELQPERKCDCLGREFEFLEAGKCGKQSWFGCSC